MVFGEGVDGRGIGEVLVDVVFESGSGDVLVVGE